MKHTYKQSEESATSSKSDGFRSAVLRLTAYYSLGVFTILVVFSVLVYGLFSSSLDDDIREDHERLEVEELFHEDARESLFGILIFSDLVLLAVTIIVSYLLSRKTLAPLQEAHLRQERFVADVAHELRTPLAVMKAGSEVILRQERSADAYQKYAEESLEETERLITLSNDLLFLASNGKENTLKKHTEVSLSSLCKKQIEMMRSYTESKGNL
jgi:signal transduction histidine kinase